jgi:ferric-dicitrate binding protein FerR (iron transport regulator)
MSKRSRKRRKALMKKGHMNGKPNGDPDANNQPQAPTSSSTPVPAPSFLKRMRKRRSLWLVAALGLVAIAGTIIVKLQNGARPGIVEYMSDDPDAQVMMEKDDGKEILLDRGTKYSTKVEPGHYKLRLVPPNESLKIPSIVNMDPGGRAYLRVERIRKAQDPKIK